MSKNYKTLYQQIDDKDQALLVKVVNDHERDIKEERIPNRTTFTNRCASNAMANSLLPIAYLPATFAIPSTNAVVRVASSSAFDDITGVGARKVLISGVGASSLPVEEEITLDGQNPVTTTISFFRINFVKVTVTGSLSYNQGNIYVGPNSGSFDTATGFVGGNYVCMGLLDNYVGNCIYTIPYGLSVYNLKCRISTTSISNQYFVKIYYREDTSKPFVLYDETVAGINCVVETLGSGKAISKGEFFFQCHCVTGSGLRIISITYSFDVIKKNYADSIEIDIFG